jgi:hypothetical protein
MKQGLERKTKSETASQSHISGTGVVGKYIYIYIYIYQHFHGRKLQWINRN